MVQAKHKKAKPKKQQIKKHGKQADITQFRSQLDVLGLKIIQVTADGNCFFRALADQLEGNEEEHNKYRLMVVQYIMNHREDFEPFIEDEVPFDEYCQSMGNDGTWAGNMELQAASLVTRRNVCIHRSMSPRWYIRNFSGKEASMLHLSYHDGEHYNSVRLQEDSCDGPAKPIVIKMDANISALGTDKKQTVIEGKGSSHRSLPDSGSIKLVMVGTGCGDTDKIEQVLNEVDGDVDAAVEFLIAEQEMFEDSNYGGNFSCERNGDDQNASCKEPASKEITDPSLTTSCIQSVKDNGNLHDDKNVAKNKEHSYGSRGKYKTSGSSVVKSSTSPVIQSKGAASKKKKETKQSRKKAAVRNVQEHEESGNLPDLGALCI